MFLDKKEYEQYLIKNGIQDTTVQMENYFERIENGEIIINAKEVNKSSINIEQYTNCITWIMLKDKKTMALLKYPFGDIYRNLSEEQYYIALYNNILLPQIAKQFQNQSAIYYFAKGNSISNNMRHLITLDFKQKDEEMVHGEDVLEEAGLDINELNIKEMIGGIEKYLLKIGAKSQDIEIIKREFIKQSLYNRFVKQADENNHNWGILVNSIDNKARIAPIYDVDCCCDVSTLRKHIRTSQDGNKYNIDSFIKDFGEYEWFDVYVQEVLEDFNLEKAINDSKVATKINIPEKVKEHYMRFFGERYYELKNAYQEYKKQQNNSYTKDDDDLDR